MTCSSCGRFHCGGEWPDGERWCQTVLNKESAPMNFALCPSCCLCGGKRECSPIEVIVISLIARRGAANLPYVVPREAATPSGDMK